jgi:hypothetical protein
MTVAADRHHQTLYFSLLMHWHQSIIITDRHLLEEESERCGVDNQCTTNPHSQQLMIAKNKSKQSNKKTQHSTSVHFQLGRCLSATPLVVSDLGNDGPRRVRDPDAIRDLHPLGGRCSDAPSTRWFCLLFSSSTSTFTYPASTLLLPLSYCFCFCHLSSNTRITSANYDKPSVKHAIQSLVPKFQASFQ